MSGKPRALGVAILLWWASTVLADADMELHKSVDTPTPSAGQPVEFTVRIRNIGADAAPDVHVHDLLPPELRIPVGMAAFTSSGAYDSVSGDWMVGDLKAGADADSVVPAVVATHISGLRSSTRPRSLAVRIRTGVTTVLQLEYDSFPSSVASISLRVSPCRCFRASFPAVTNDMTRSLM